MDRINFIREFFDHSGKGLEIGPSHQPVFPKCAGYDVDILDYANAEELRIKYANSNVNVSAIEEVDFVSDGRPLHEIIPHRNHYDYIFSSHVIEHVTDFLSYFKSCEMLLKPGGVVALAIPEQRYVFDAIRRLSTTGDVLEAYHARRCRHAPGDVFDFGSSFCRFSGQQTWTKTSIGELVIDGTITHGKQLLDGALSESNPYLDVHGWTFTASSFRLIIKDLNDLGYLTLREKNVAEAGALEFYVTLGIDAQGCSLSRLELVEKVLQEEAVSRLQLLSGKSEKHRILFELVANQLAEP